MHSKVRHFRTVKALTAETVELGRGDEGVPLLSRSLAIFSTAIAQVDLCFGTVLERSGRGGGPALLRYRSSEACLGSKA